MSYDTNQPSLTQYQALQEAYNYLNDALFDGELPQCIIVLHRKRGANGYFWHAMWAEVGDQEQKLDEISLTPDTLDRGDELVLSTLAHEMVHLWQAHFGKPSKTAYHNKEWAQKMFIIGLHPTHDGTPEGKPTGQSVKHIVLPDGAFHEAITTFLAERKAINWYGIARTKATSNKKNKTLYMCSCENKVWGKPGLTITCGKCDETYVEQGE